MQIYFIFAADLEKVDIIMRRNIKIILAGGYLGEGKTTLLWKESQYLMKRGKKTGLCACLEKEALPTGHVKALLEHNDNAIVVNFTGGKDTITVCGAAGVGDECRLLINAREKTTPENLDAIVRDTLYAYTSSLSCIEVAWKYLQPGRPNPTYRFYKEK